MRRFLALVLLLSLYTGAAACSDNAPPAAPPAAPSTESGLPVVEVRYDGGVIHAELADDTDERARGLGGRALLPERTGMLFDLGATRVPSFWMKDTLIPLDMVWVGEDMRIQGITTHVQPEPGVPDHELRRYSPSEPVRYVLELNAGAAAALGLATGVALTFDLR